MPKLAALKQWHQHIAQALLSQQAPSMACELVCAIQQWLSFDTAIVLLYPAQQAPVLLYDDYPSPSTVKVHRKNIYERLNINTQAELFNLFLLHLDKLVR
jgi:hypothetical protein